VKKVIEGTIRIEEESAGFHSSDVIITTTNGGYGESFDLWLDKHFGLNEGSGSRCGASQQKLPGKYRITVERIE